MFVGESDFRFAGSLPSGDDLGASLLLHWRPLQTAIPCVNMVSH